MTALCSCSALCFVLSDRSKGVEMFLLATVLLLLEPHAEIQSSITISAIFFICDTSISGIVNTWSLETWILMSGSVSCWELLWIFLEVKDL